MDATHRFDLSSFIIRWIICLFLVFATYNPSGYSFFHWIGEADGWWLAKIAVGALLFSGNGLIISYGFRALNFIGVLMATVFLCHWLWAIQLRNHLHRKFSRDNGDSGRVGKYNGDRCFLPTCVVSLHRREARQQHLISPWS